MDLFYDLINYEFDQTNGVETFERDFLNLASILLVSSGRGDGRYVTLFQQVLSDWVGRHCHLSTVGRKVIDRLTQGMKLLLEYRDSGDNILAHVSCLVNLSQFFYRCSRFDLYRDYIFKLYEFQLSHGSRIEASYCLQKIGQTLEFEHGSFNEDWSRKLFPAANSQAEVKELAISAIIELMDESKLWHDAIEQCKVLESYYIKLNEFDQLSDLLRMRSSLTSKLSSPSCLYTYFYIAFWGRSFPNSFQNLVMIARGDQLERLEDFQVQIMTNFPKAEILSTSETLGDEVKNKSAQCIQIFPVKPVNGETDHFCRHFEHRRSYGTKDKSGLEHRWVERRIFTATDAFPGISATAKVVNVKTIHSKPIEVAIDSIREKNGELRQAIAHYTADASRDGGHLAMLLQGTIDPRVNGGYKVYEDAFLSPNSDCSTDHKDRLRKAIANQIPILERALLIHSKIIQPQLLPLHNALAETFKTMKKDVEDRYGKVEQFNDEKKRIRCLRRIVDPDGDSIESNSSSDIRSKAETLHRRVRPVSWMESCNTLGSISNYGGSEQSLTERGRRRRSKPTEWFHSLIGSQKNLSVANSDGKHAVHEKSEIILREQVVNMRPRRPCSLPRSPRVSTISSPKKMDQNGHVPCIKTPALPNKTKSKFSST